MVRHGLQQGAQITRPKRLAIVTSSYPANYADFAAAFIPGFASALVELGCTVTVLTPDKATPKEKPPTHSVRWFTWAGSTKALVDFNLRSPTDLRRTLSLLRAGERALNQLIDEERIEACLACWAIPAGYLAWRVRSRVPYAVWALGSDIHTWARRPLVGALVRTVLRDATNRFADGIELAAEVTRISGKECQFLPSSRRLPEPTALPRPLAPGINFLFVGRLEPVKGADVMVEAMIHAIASGIDARLIMCGTGSLEATLRGRVQAAGAADRIGFLSGQPGAVIAGYMAACDCLVVPSRMESIPVVFSEALQSGIPLLLSDVGDMGELARQHGLATPVPPGDAAALSTAMVQFVQRRDEEVRRYAEAREELLSIFDVRAAAGRYLAALEAG